MTDENISSHSSYVTIGGKKALFIDEYLEIMDDPRFPEVMAKFIADHRP